MPYARLCSFTFAVFAMLSFFFPQSSYFYLVYFKVTKEIELCTLHRIISHRNDSFAIQKKSLMRPFLLNHPFSIFQSKEVIKHCILLWNHIGQTWYSFTIKKKGQNKY